VDWTDPTQDGIQGRTLANTEIELRVLENFWEFLSRCTTGEGSAP
jgi:hypothetical protein